MAKTLWQPSAAQIRSTQLAAFEVEAARRTGRCFEDYRALHRWSIEEPAEFWALVWDFCEVLGDRGSLRVVAGEGMPGTSAEPA